MLQSTFLDELFKGCTLNEEVFQNTSLFLKDKDVSKDAILHKKVLNSIRKLYKRDPDTLPTLGILEQMSLAVGGKSLSFDRISNAARTPSNILLSELQNYLLKVKVEQSLHSFESEYNQGNHNTSILKLRDDLVEAIDFDISGEEYRSSNPFKEFFNILKRIEEEEVDTSKVPFGIPPLDALSMGGMEATSMALFILRSGVGKSTILKFIGWMASRLGYRVLHFQLEGSEVEAQMKYNQIWTGTRFYNLMNGRFGTFDKPKVIWDSKIGKIEITDKLEYIELMQSKMDYMRKNMGKYILEIASFEEFGVPDMKMVDQKISDFADKYGPPHLVVIDSLDLVYPGDGFKYGSDIQGVKMRIQNSAKAMKNIALRWKTRIVSSIQTGDVKMEDWNNEDFVIDRSKSLGDKNVANPFSFVFSGNRTIKEKKLNQIRFFVDKLRDYDGEGSVFSVPTDYDHGKAINLRMLKEENETEGESIVE